MVVRPLPDATSTCGIVYVPIPDVLSTATANAVLPSAHWSEYVIVDAAIKCKEKEESDTGSLERAKLNIIQRIERYSARFDHNPKPIIDAHALESDDLGITEIWY